MIMPNFTKLPVSTVQSFEKCLPLLHAHNETLDSDTLFLNNEVVFIMHHGDCYSLRRTRNNKLILTK